MRSPLEDGAWLELASVDSTQDAAANLLRLHDDAAVPGVIMTTDQTAGRGRFGRKWHGDPGDSLAMSLVMKAYRDHPKPYLIGMAVAVAAVGAIHGHLRWPNDLLLGGRKAGGVLTELLPDAEGRLVPVVGLGINLNQKGFPEEIADLATSVAMYHGGEHDAAAVGHSILDRLCRLPEPDSWDALEPLWMLFDETPGKHYKLPDGREGVAIGVGPDGRLLCSVGGETVSTMAAEAWAAGVPAGS